MERRTLLVTAGSVAAVVLTAAAAVGANVGILDRAGVSGIGELSASTTVTTIAADTAPLTQDFAVEQAGTVQVVDDGSGLHAGRVTAVAGWTWTVDRDGPETVVVTFSPMDAGSGVSGYVFTAGRGTDGGIVAHVDRSADQVAPAPTVTGAADDDGHADDESDDGRPDDDGGYEHEGRYDDD